MNNGRRLYQSSWIIALALTLASCSHDEHPAPAAPETVRGLPVVEVKPTTVSEWLEAVGTVYASSTSTLSSRVTGNILEIRVREGDRVGRGQTLVVIDHAQPSAALEGARAALAAARQEVSATNADYGLADATFRRYQDLFDKKSVSPQEFDEVKARRQMALARRERAQAAEAQTRAAVEQAQISLNDATVRAPFDGVVTQKKADPGMLATPGMPLLVVEDTRRYRLEAGLDESEMRLVRLGQRADVVLDALGGEMLAGKVAEIVPAADPSSRTFTVKIEVPPNSRVRSGLFGRARFSRGERRALLVPYAAVKRRGQLEAVYVVGSGQIATVRFVTLGTPSGDHIEVLSGLAASERIVAAPGDRDLGGKRIEVQP